MQRVATKKPRARCLRSAPCVMRPELVLQASTAGLASGYRARLWPPAGKASLVKRITITVTGAGDTRLSDKQGLTLVHVSAQLEPCLTHNNILRTVNTP